MSNDCLRFFRCLSYVFTPQLPKPAPTNARQIYVSINFLFVIFIFFIFVSSSLVSAPDNFKGLLLRSHVLYRLKHYQSSLADVDNALNSRPSSYKVSFPFAFSLLFLLLLSATNKLRGEKCERRQESTEKSAQQILIKVK